MTSLDIYDDLEDYDVQVKNDELLSQLNQAEETIKQLREELNEKNTKISELEKENLTLKTNISNLYVTAKREINRKTKKCKELRRCNDDLVFKRDTKLQHSVGFNNGNGVNFNNGQWVNYASIENNGPSVLSTELVQPKIENKIELSEYKTTSFPTNIKVNDDLKVSNNRSKSSNTRRSQSPNARNFRASIPRRSKSPIRCSKSPRSRRSRSPLKRSRSPHSRHSRSPRSHQKRPFYPDRHNNNFHRNRNINDNRNKNETKNRGNSRDKHLNDDRRPRDTRSSSRERYIRALEARNPSNLKNGKSNNFKSKPPKPKSPEPIENQEYSSDVNDLFEKKRMLEQLLKMEEENVDAVDKQEENGLKKLRINLTTNTCIELPQKCPGAVPTQSTSYRDATSNNSLMESNEKIINSDVNQVKNSHSVYRKEVINENRIRFVAQRVRRPKN